MKQLLKILILSLMSYSLTAGAASFQCESLFATERPFKKLKTSLRTIYAKEIKRLSSHHISNVNLQTLRKLEKYVPPATGRRASGISSAQAKQLIQVSRNHEVVGYPADQGYERGGAIGYCFGRAAYAHLMLLKMGVQKESIRKVWVAGNMLENKITWEYHVATIVYTHDLGWVSIDSIFDHPKPIGDWLRHFNAQSQNDKFRFYVTPAEKFNFQLGKYDRSQMGLDLTPEQDWFRNYFVDMLRSISNANLDQLGLKKVNASPKEDATLIQEVIEDAEDFIEAK